MTPDQTARISELLTLLEKALNYAYSGSAEYGSFLRPHRAEFRGEFVPSVFMTFDELRDLLQAQAERLAELEKQVQELQNDQSRVEPGATPWRTGSTAAHHVPVRTGSGS